MYQRKLCHLQHLKGKKTPITKQNSIKEVRKKEMGLMNNLSCPRRSVSEGHHLPSCTPRHNPLSVLIFCLLEYFWVFPLHFMAGSRLFPLWLQYQPKAYKQAQQVLFGNQCWQGISPKASEPFAMSLTYCLVFSPSSRFTSRLQNIPQRTYANRGKQTL